MKKLLLGIILIMLFSCSIEKRIYRPGHHIIFNTSKKQITLEQVETKNNKICVLSEVAKQIATMDNEKFVLSFEDYPLIASTINNSSKCKPINESDNKTDLIIKNHMPVSNIVKLNKKAKQYNKFKNSPNKGLFILFLILAILTIYTLIGPILFGLLSYHFYKKHKSESLPEVTKEKEKAPIESPKPDAPNNKESKAKIGVLIAGISFSVLALLLTCSAIYFWGGYLALILALICALLSIIFGLISLIKGKTWWWKLISIIGLIITLIADVIYAAALG